MTNNRSSKAALFLFLFACGLMQFSLLPAARSQEAIPIADVTHDGPVDFEKDILPIFRKNCLACHNATEAESGLILETPASILEGGNEGPAVVAGNSAESLLLQLSARERESFMPPEDNDVGAMHLTSQELGLIKLWINEGAKGEVRGTSGVPQWQPLPAGINPIFAVAISPDGQYAAAGRANQVFIYHVPSKREIGRLTDPSLLDSGIYENPGVAFFDVVQSLAFSPDSEVLAAGGFRTVKLFRRPRNVRKAELAGIQGPVRSMALSADSKWSAVGQEDGKILVFDMSTNQVVKTLEGHSAAVTGLAFNQDASQIVSASLDATFRLWTVAEGQLTGQPATTPAPINSVALVVDGTQIATAHEDNVIRIWDLAMATAVPAEGATPVAPLKELQGHGGPVTSLATVQANGSQLASGSRDGTLRHWDVAAGTQIRSFNHGGPVESVATRGDSTRFASAGSNNIAKLWNAQDGAQIVELKGDFRTRIMVDDLTLAMNLAKRRVDLAKADLEAAKKRQEDETKNATTAEENLKKADEEFKAKDEAAKQPVADKAAADKALEEAKVVATKAEETKKVADEAAVAAEAALTAAKTALEAANKEAADAAAAFNAANDAATKAQAAVDADAANEDLKTANEAAQATKAEAEKVQTAANEKKTAAEKTVTDAETAKKTADEAKQKAEQEFTAATTASKQAEEKVTQLTAPAQKAVDEKNAADRALKAAQRSVERAKEAVKKATDAVPVVENELKLEEAKHQESTGVQQAAQQKVTESEKPLYTLAFSPDGTTLAVAGEDHQIHTFDSETGVPIDTLTGQGAAIRSIAFTADNNVVSAAANNTLVVWNGSNEWQLERTIGKQDDPTLLVDRVTAVGFNRAGTILATGSGEPSRSGELKLWNVSDGSLVRAIEEPHSDTVFSIEFSPDDQHIASCAADRFMKVFQVADGSFVRSFEGHTHHVLGVSWSAEGRSLATAGADKVVKIWDFKTGDQKRTIQGFGKEVTSIRFIAITETIIAACGDKNVHVKNAANGGNVRVLGGGTDFMYGAAASSNGKVFIGAGQDSVVRLWKDDGNVIANFSAPEPTPSGGAE
ncbi:MAG: hypothetical protein MK165_16770 [Pirellulaceae bacterium]|nr:hypothetical protein [Pirellulaceae bacterium]